MAAAAPALSLAPMATTVTAAAAQKAASPKAAAGGDVRKVVPVMAAAADEVVVQELHVLAVDDSVVDRAVIAKILRSSKYRGTKSTET